MQLMGRTARQGQSGTFEMILKMEEVNGIGISEEEVVKCFNEGESPYKKICNIRDSSFESEATKMIEKIKEVNLIHNTSNQFHELLSSTAQDREKVLKLWKQISPESIQTKDFHVIFCLDCSGSMSYNVKSINGNQSRWNALVGAVNSFLNMRRDANARDIITITEYDHKFYLQCEAKPLTRDFQKDMIFHSGGTNFAKGLLGAKQVIDRNDHNVYTPVLLFLSDGECNNGEVEMEQICNAHKANGLLVKTLGFCDGGEEKLTKLAEIGEGQFLNSIDGIQLDNTFKKIALELFEGSTK